VGLKNAMVNLAGLKWTNHEGGIRVPMIVSWPGTLPHGKVCHGLVANYDHMATFADLAGVRMPEGKDAVSYKNMLLGKPGKLRDYIVIDHTIITGDGWKLTMKNGQWLLFQISRDPEERNNLAEKQPKQLERLQAIYKKEAGSPRKDR
jgi:cerebroside-sulfatase